MNIPILAITLVIIGVLTGWIAPMIVKSRRPYGLAGDVIAGIIVMLFGLVEWIWIMPVFDFAEWLDITACIGDPFAGVLIVLWLMRKIKPELPERY